MGAASGGSRQVADITEWVAATFPARTIDGVTFYDPSGVPERTADA